MPFKFLPDIALADVAFEASSPTLSGLFEAAAAAMTEVMVDRRTLGRSRGRSLRLAAEDTDRLLYDFLTELIVVKDIDLLLFRTFRVRVAEDGKSMEARLQGAKIDRKRQKLRNDVKAVTMHMFGIRRHGQDWAATVVLDI